uniref:Peptidase A1 domain-containing protein n=1 Tax=Parascaris univalens TaxID=6257 RepID=A0A915BV80_PARUN
SMMGAVHGKYANKPAILLMLLVVLIEHALAVFRIQVAKIESERSKRIRSGLPPKWRTLTLAGKYSTVVTDYSDVEYVGTITMGSQRTPMRVVLDTGSADFWVPDISCGICDYYCHGLPTMFCNKLCSKGCCSLQNGFTRSKCPNKLFFNAITSNTYSEQNGTWRIKYGSGMAAGFYGQDITNLGGMNINVTFGQATVLDPQLMADAAFDGILGLAFQSLSIGHTLPPFLAAHQQNIINEAIFTVFLRRAGYAGSLNGGVYTFGGFDNVNCDSRINYVSLSSATYFQFRLEKFYFGTTLLATSTTEVISDTGTSFIGAPSKIVESVAQAIGAKPDQSGYVIPCNYGQLPNMIFVIGGYEYTVTSDNYIVRMGDRRCELAMVSLQSMGLQISWILGDPFIREYCNVHDMQNRRIGFAKSRQY